MDGQQQPFETPANLTQRLDIDFALQAAGLGVWELDPVTNQVLWDDRCRQLFGLAKDNQLPYQQAIRFIHPHDQTRVDQAVQLALSGQSDGQYDVTYRTMGADDGRLRWVRFMGKAEFTPGGQVYRFAGVAQEVTQQVLTQRHLEDSETRFRSLIEEARIATCLLVGRELRIDLANQPLIDIWGRGPTVLGKPLALAIPEVAGQSFLDLLDEVYTTGKSYEAWASRAEVVVDGELRSYYFDFTYKALRDAEGQVYAILVTSIDVTQQVLARREAEANLRQFRTLLQAIPQMTWTNTPTGEVDFYNERWYAYTGLSLAQTRDWGWQAVVYPDDLPRTVARFEQALATGEEFIVENRYRQADGQYRWHLNRALPLYAEDGQLVKWVGTATDIHEQKQLEAQLEEQVQQRTQELVATNKELLTTNEDFIAANKALEAANHDLIRSNKNLEQFAYVASHDLQEPLRKIQQFGDLLTNQYGDGLGDGVAYLERMQTAATRMSVLIRDLLAFSRISTTQVIAQPVALNQVVSRVLDTLSVVVEESRAQVEVSSLPVVPGDRSQLDQLFQNLLSNAVKFRRTNSAGELVTPQIRVKASLVAESQLPPSVQPSRYAQAYHCIEVADNGIGFEEKYLDRMFQVFQRLHGKSAYAGTGIGLAIVQKVVINHGGAITATSEPGQGATFLMYLPA